MPEVAASASAHRLAKSQVQARPTVVSLQPQLCQQRRGTRPGAICGLQQEGGQGLCFATPVLHLKPRAADFARHQLLSADSIKGSQAATFYNSGGVRSSIKQPQRARIQLSESQRAKLRAQREAEKQRERQVLRIRTALVAKQQQRSSIQRDSKSAAYYPDLLERHELTGSPPQKLDPRFVRRAPQPQPQPQPAPTPKQPQQVPPSKQPQPQPEAPRTRDQGVQAYPRLRIRIRAEKGIQTEPPQPVSRRDQGTQTRPLLSYPAESVSSKQ